MPNETIYGRNAVNEALRAGKHRLRRIFVLESAADKVSKLSEPVGVTSRQTRRSAERPFPQQEAKGKGRAYTDPRNPANASFHKDAPTADTTEAEDEAHGALASIVQQAKTKNIAVERLARFDLDQMTNRANHQGVAAESEPFAYTSFAHLLELAQQDVVGDTPGRDPSPFFLVLDYLQDPQNLGTLIRTAEAVGATGVILPERRAAGVTPAVRNASSGAVEWMRVCQVTNLAQTLEALKGAGVWVGGLDRGNDAVGYDKANYTGKLALVVGSEGSGIGRLVRQKCDFIIQLPMLGHIESLNAATAGSITMYEALRQRNIAPQRATKGV